MSTPNSPQSRRTFIKRGTISVAGTAVAGGLPALAYGADAALAADTASLSPVVRENTLADPSTFSTGYRVTNLSSAVEGYARRTSVNLGEPIELVISGPNAYLQPPENPPSESVEVELYRLGYYGGKGARLVWRTPAPVSTWQRFTPDGTPANSWDGGVEPADYPSSPDFGLRGRAKNATTVTIPGSATPETGVYLAKLKGRWLDFPGGVPAVERSGESHITFVVRDDARPRDLLAVLPTNTWQAYNYWGGRSLYTYSSRYQNAGAVLAATGSERAAKLSLDRPYNNWIADYNWVLRCEFAAIWWLEQQGYDVSYTDDVALTFAPDQLLPTQSKGLAILGHGEYWTKEARDGVEAARDAGTNIYNFGANTAYWSVRYEDANGKPATNADDARVLVCYKTIEGGGSAGLDVAGTADPVSPTTTFRDTGKGAGVSLPGTTAATPASYKGPNRPESALFGVQYIGDDDKRSRGLTVPADNGKGEFAGHRAWRNGAVPKTGTTIGTDLLGWEWDGIPAVGQPYGVAPKTKAGTSLQRLSESDPRVNAPTGNSMVYVQDGGRKYGGFGSATAMPPSGWTPFAHAVTYTAPSGALVFSSGTLHWAFGLGPHHLQGGESDTYASAPIDSTQAPIRQATANLLVDGGIRPATPSGVVIDSGGPTDPTDPTGPTTPADTAAPKTTIGVTNSSSWLLGWTYVSSRVRTLSVRVAIDKAEKSGPVKIDALLSDKKGDLGSATGTVQPGKNVVVDIVMSAATFKRVSSTLALSSTLKVTTTDAAGNKTVTTQTVRLRAN